MKKKSLGCKEVKGTGTGRGRDREKVKGVLNRKKYRL